MPYVRTDTRRRDGSSLRLLQRTKDTPLRSPGRTSSGEIASSVSYAGATIQIASSSTEFGISRGDNSIRGASASPKYSPSLECDGRRRERRSGRCTTPRCREPSSTAEVGRELYARQGGPCIAGPRGCWVGRGTSRRPRLSAPWPQGQELGCRVTGKRPESALDQTSRPPRS